MLALGYRLLDCPYGIAASREFALLNYPSDDDGAARLERSPDFLHVLRRNIRR